MKKLTLIFVLLNLFIVTAQNFFLVGSTKSSVEEPTTITVQYNNVTYKIVFSKKTQSMYVLSSDPNDPNINKPKFIEECLNFFSNTELYDENYVISHSE